MRTHISLPRLFQLSLKYRSTSFQGSISDSWDTRGQLKWSWTKTSGQLKNCHVIATLDKRWCGWKKSVSWHQGVVQWGFKNTRKGSVTEKSAWGNDHLFCLQSFAYGSAFSLLIYHSAPLHISLVLLPIHYPIVWVFFFSLCALTTQFLNFPSRAETKWYRQCDFVTQNFMSSFSRTISSILIQKWKPRNSPSATSSYRKLRPNTRGVFVYEFQYVLVSTA